MGVWTQAIAAILAFVVLIFLFFFSWYPLLPEWLQNRLSFATERISSQTAEQAQNRQGEREGFGQEEFNVNSSDEASGEVEHPQ